MRAYPVVLTPDDNGTLLVTCPDLPEVATCGDDEAEAVARAVDAIETILMAYIADKRDIPAPSRPKRGQKLAVLPVLTEMKLALYEAMRANAVGKAEGSE